MSERALVLVVDDDEAIREAVVAFLEDEGYRDDAGGKWGRGLRPARRAGAPPALIVVDLMMPGMDGWMFCRLRQGIRMLRETPVLAMSAGRVLELQEPLRVDALLPKPFDPDQLIWLVTKLAGKQRRTLQ